MMSYWIMMGPKSHDWCLKNSKDFQFSGFQAILATSSIKKYNLHYDYSMLNKATPSKDIWILTFRTCECHSGPLGLGHIGQCLQDRPPQVFLRFAAPPLPLQWLHFLSERGTKLRVEVCEAVPVLSPQPRSLVLTALWLFSSRAFMYWNLCPSHLCPVNF